MPDDLLRIAVDALLAKFTAEREAAEHLARAEESRARARAAEIAARAAMWDLYHHEDGWSAPKISRGLLTGLAVAGIPGEQLERAGVSHDSVRRIVMGERPEVPE